MTDTDTRLARVETHIDYLRDKIDGHIIQSKEYKDDTKSDLKEIKDAVKSLGDKMNARENQARGIWWAMTAGVGGLAAFGGYMLKPFK